MLVDCHMLIVCIQRELISPNLVNAVRTSSCETLREMSHARMNLFFALILSKIGVVSIWTVDLSASVIFLALLASASAPNKAVIIFFPCCTEVRTEMKDSRLANASEIVRILVKLLLPGVFSQSTCILYLRLPYSTCQLTGRRVSMIFSFCFPLFFF